MRIEKRTLAPEEVYRAIAAGGPLQDLQVDETKLAQMTIAVVEVDGEIAAYWVAWYALHTEPLWIDPRWQKHAGVVKGIVDQMGLILEATEEAAAFCVVEDETMAVVEPYVHRLGFQDAPGKLYYLVLPPRDLPPAEEEG